MSINKKEREALLSFLEQNKRKADEAMQRFDEASKRFDETMKKIRAAL